MEFMATLSIITFFLTSLQMVHSQIIPVPQCRSDPYKCPNPSQPAIQSCCCFGSNSAACNNRTDCVYIPSETRCKTALATGIPSMDPTQEPTQITIQPTTAPTRDPTQDTNAPTLTPTKQPTVAPTAATTEPTSDPTPDPIPDPSPHPTPHPVFTKPPSINPSLSPILSPSQNPSSSPTLSPSLNPSLTPTLTPSLDPSLSPTLNPSQTPSLTPSDSPSFHPSLSPSLSPTQTPTYDTLSPSQTPSHSPNNDPTSRNPTIEPTHIPTLHPTVIPTSNPTFKPTIHPSEYPTYFPTFEPTLSPTYFPIYITTFNPTQNPIFTSNPTANPTYDPTIAPSVSPTVIPTVDPTETPTNPPTYCTECEIYNLTLTDIKSNLTIKECPKPKEPNCECNGAGMTSLTLMYIGHNTASKIEILYKYGNIVCSYETIKPNTEIVCDLKEASDYRKFRQITKYRIYFQSKASEHYCVGQYDTSCETYILGQVYSDCPYLSINGWSDANGDMCFNDGTNVKINYWIKKTVNSDSSNKDSKSKDSKSSDSRRNGPLYDVSHSSDSSSSSSRRRILNDDDDIFSKCIWNNNKQIRYLWDTNHDCDDDSDSSERRRRSLLWNRGDSSSSSSSSEDDDDKPSKILAEVCLTYNIGRLKDDCGELLSVFMPLCTNNETDFNVNDITADDVTDLIVSYEPEHGLIAVGHKDNNGTLGILAQFLSDITVFELCLDNVSMDINNALDYSKSTLDAADPDRVTFNISNISSICSSDSLPCLNFYFKEKCDDDDDVATMKIDRNCDCSGGGLISISLLYSANYDAEEIEVYNNRRRTKLLCTFSNISSSDIVVCEESMQRKTYFRIKYTNDYGICEGVVLTDCSVNILGQKSSGCNALIVVGWMDKTETICDELVNDDTIVSNNAFTRHRFNIVDALQVLNQVNIYIKWTLIGMMIMFAVLMMIALFLCLYGKKFGIGIRKMSKDEEYVSSTADSIEENIEKQHDAKHFKSVIKKESESNASTKSVVRRHKSINFDEEEIVLECFYDEEEEDNDDDEDDVMKELRARSVNLHAKHKSINLSEELILNSIWNECDDENKNMFYDSNDSQQMLNNDHDEPYLD